MHFYQVSIRHHVPKNVLKTWSHNRLGKMSFHWLFWLRYKHEYSYANWKNVIMATTNILCPFVNRFPPNTAKYVGQNASSPRCMHKIPTPACRGKEFLSYSNKYSEKGKVRWDCMSHRPAHSTTSKAIMTRISVEGNILQLVSKGFCG